jgi:hypothetical protein
MIAVAGVLVAAVLASCVVMPAVGQTSTLDGMWLGAAIMGLPSAAVLAVTGYRHYGWARSLAVAVTIALVTCLISWVVAIFAVASALSGSAIGWVLGIALYGTPALTVVILGLVALKFVPAAQPPVDRLSMPAAGKPAA